jgi:SAM-dependent methyltransferase
MNSYSTEFFEEMRPSSHRSAEIVVPCVMEMLRPTSILDVGCGSGEWLAAFADKGVKDIFGVDGEWARKGLTIPELCFKEWNLEELLQLGRRFDLVLSVEVAEHLPDSASETFVGSLARHSDNILFSAAVPGQYGTQHQNEQFVEYWATKFVALGYIPVDCFRPLLWNREGVEYWYAQNIVFYTKNQQLALQLGNEAFPLTGGGLPYSLIHPTLQKRNSGYIELLTDPVNYSISKMVAALPRIVNSRIRKWLSKK